MTDKRKLLVPLEEGVFIMVDRVIAVVELPEKIKPSSKHTIATLIAKAKEQNKLLDVGHPLRMNRETAVLFDTGFIILSDKKAYNIRRKIDRLVRGYKTDKEEED